MQFCQCALGGDCLDTEDERKQRVIDLFEKVLEQHKDALEALKDL